MSNKRGNKNNRFGDKHVLRGTAASPIGESVIQCLLSVSP